jgi:hypothetical protein
LVHPAPRLIFAWIAVLAIGFALELRAVPSSVLVPETIQPKDFDPRASPGSQSPDNREWRVASLDTEALFESAPKHSDRQSNLVTSTTGGASSAEDLAIEWRAASFDERFAGTVDSSGSRQATDHILLPSPELNRHAVAGGAVGPSVRGLAPLRTLPSASVSRKQIRVADALAPEDSGSPPDADGHTALYDIAAHKVYLPNGQRLEAHSGFGHYLDNPRFVSEKDRGPTPPNVYDLSLREERFHGVRAIRLIPVGDGNMFGRDGMLAHSYMLGPTGQSNGCVSFSDYPSFLNAVLNGEVNRLVVVEHLANTPGAKTTSGWLPDAIKALFGRT